MLAVQSAVLLVAVLRLLAVQNYIVLGVVACATEIHCVGSGCMCHRITALGVVCTSHGAR